MKKIEFDATEFLLEDGSLSEEGKRRFAETISEEMGASYSSEKKAAIIDALRGALDQGTLPEVSAVSLRKTIGKFAEECAELPDAVRGLAFMISQRDGVGAHVFMLGEASAHLRMARASFEAAVHCLNHVIDCSSSKDEPTDPTKRN